MRAARFGVHHQMSVPGGISGIPTPSGIPTLVCLPHPLSGLLASSVIRLVYVPPRYSHSSPSGMPTSSGISTPTPQYTPSPEGTWYQGYPPYRISLEAGKNSVSVRDGPGEMISVPPPPQSPDEVRPFLALKIRNAVLEEPPRHAKLVFRSEGGSVKSSHQYSTD